MKVERKLVLTNEEKTMLICLRDRLEYLLKDEDDFDSREDADTLYDALWKFCEDLL
jgi:hypothetical protein